MDLADLISNIVFLILGAVVGYYFNEIMDAIKSKKKQKAISEINQKVVSNLQTEKANLEQETGIIQLANGAPYYKEGNLSTEVREDIVFYVPIPESFRGELQKRGFIKNNGVPYEDKYNCLSDRFVLKKAFDTGFGCFGKYTWDATVKAEIRAIAETQAQVFLDDLKARKPRFNGSMLGVKENNPNRDNSDHERNTYKIIYYKTDYFTYRVFAQFYANHLDEFRRLNAPNGELDTNVLQRLSIPFLSSFGVACIVVGTTGDHHELHFNEDDFIISGYRGNNVIVDQNKLHFGMNEAFSLSMDSDSSGVAPSYKQCVERGLMEELIYIDPKTEDGQRCKSFIGTPYFFDFILDSNKCEEGLTAIVKLKFQSEEPIKDENGEPIPQDGFTTDSFLKRYNAAKDRLLETKGLEFTPIKDLDTFLNERGKSMSMSYYAALCNLQTRLQIKAI